MEVVHNLPFVQSDRCFVEQELNVLDSCIHRAIPSETLWAFAFLICGGSFQSWFSIYKPCMLFLTCVS
jgi:hypothetical protein